MSPNNPLYTGVRVPSSTLNPFELPKGSITHSWLHIALLHPKRPPTSLLGAQGSHWSLQTSLLFISVNPVAGYHSWETLETSRGPKCQQRGFKAPEDPRTCPEGLPPSLILDGPEWPISALQRGSVASAWALQPGTPGLLVSRHPVLRPRQPT